MTKTKKANKAFFFSIFFNIILGFFAVSLQILLNFDIFSLGEIKND